MILVDSSVWIDYFKGNITPQTDKLDLLLGREPLAIGDLILAEVLQGFDSDREFHQARRLLSSLLLVEIGGRKSQFKPQRISVSSVATVSPSAGQLTLSSQLAASRVGTTFCTAIAISIRSQLFSDFALSPDRGWRSSSNL